MKTESVLVVDDEEPMRRSVSAALVESGFECVPVSSVRAARLELARRHFDLVVCDLRMPGESGMALIKDIESGSRQMPVLMMTSVDDPQVAHEAAIHGSNGYLVKPFSANELRINVDQAHFFGKRQRLGLDHFQLGAAFAERQCRQENRLRNIRQ